MKRKKTVRKDAVKSLKTFFLYSVAVVIVIIIALLIKFFFVVRSSIFDGAHQFVIAVSQERKVVEIVSYDPSSDSTSVLQLQNSNLTLPTFGETLGILPNTTFNFRTVGPLTKDATQLVWQMIRQYRSAETNMTFLDLIRLFLFSRSVPQINKQVQSVTLPLNQLESNNLIISLFTDQTMSSENTTIQIINGTDISGLGGRLERVLANQGANVVSVITAENPLQQSTIQYYGSSSYTLTKLMHLLNFPVSKLDQQGVADIVITIGEDEKNETGF